MLYGIAHCTQCNTQALCEQITEKAMTGQTRGRRRVSHLLVGFAIWPENLNLFNTTVYICCAYEELS